MGEYPMRPLFPMAVAAVFTAGVLAGCFRPELAPIPPEEAVSPEAVSGQSGSGGEQTAAPPPEEPQDGVQETPADPPDGKKTEPETPDGKKTAPEPADERNEGEKNPGGDPVPVKASETGFVYRAGREYGELRHRGSAITFQPGNIRAQFNGGLIHLLHAPARDAEGNILLHPQDVRTVITPLLTGRTGIGRKVKTILIDPGHGGQEPGARGKRHREKDLNLALARKVADELAKRGFEVKMTRSADLDLPLDARGAMTGELRADLFLSIHHNASVAEEVTGIETYALTPAGAESTNGRGTVSEEALPGNRFDAAGLILAREIQSRLHTATGGPDRGVRFARFRVLAQSRCPAVLIEAGFITNPEEEKAAAGEERQKKVVKAIADGVVEFNRLCGE